MKLGELIHVWSSLPFGSRSSSATVCAERSVSADFTCICTIRRAFPQQEQASLRSSLTDSPPSHYEVRSCVWRQWRILGPEFHSSCMQCSHWGHLIRLTSAGALGTECATRSLGESIIPRLMWPWHPQPPIYLRVEVLFLCLPFPLPLKGLYIFFLLRHHLLEPEPHHRKIQTITLHW